MKCRCSCLSPVPEASVCSFEASRSVEPLNTQPRWRMRWDKHSDEEETLLLTLIMIVMKLNGHRCLMVAYIIIKLKYNYTENIWNVIFKTIVDILSKGYGWWTVNNTFLYCGEGGQGLRLFILYVRQRSTSSFISTLISIGLYTPSWTCSCLKHMQGL